MLERYLDGNVNLARKHASYAWGDRSFTIMATNTIAELTAANGFLDGAGALNDKARSLSLNKCAFQVLVSSAS